MPHDSLRWRGACTPVRHCHRRSFGYQGVLVTLRKGFVFKHEHHSIFSKATVFNSLMEGLLDSRENESTAKRS